MVICLGEVRAQEEPELYYPYARPEPWQPMLKSDTTLFFRAILHPEDLYGEVTRYAFSEVAAARRGVGYADERYTLGGLAASRRNLQLLARISDSSPASLTFAALNQEPFVDVRQASHRLSLHLTDSRHRIGAAYRLFTPLGRDWQLGLLVDGRTGRDAHILGVYEHSLRSALHLQKQWDDRMRLVLLAAFAPSERALCSSSTEEAFELVGDNYYNPAWGFWQGEERSSRVRRELLPLLGAGFEWRLTKATTLRAMALAEFGFLRSGSLGWFDAQTPRPDNYRKMPSYFSDPTLQTEVANRWRSHDSRYTQIDWQELYAQNSLSRDGARYVEQDAVEGITDLKLSLGAQSRIGEGLTLHYALEAAYRLSCHYLELRDLLGADYLLDIDYYLQDDDTYASSLQNDMHNPNRRVAEGERFGYYYAFEQQRLGLCLSAEYHTSRWRVATHLRVAREQLQRDGFYEKELFAGSGSYGRSRSLEFAPWLLHAEAAYAFTPRQSLALRIAIEERTPRADDLFLQPQYNNRTIDRPTLERHYDLELAYRRISYLVEWSLAAYLRGVSNALLTDRVYDDLAAAYSDRVVEGIATRYYGLEAAARIRPHRRWSLTVALTALRSAYSANPKVSLYDDRDNRLLSDRSESYMKGLTPGGVPQLAALFSASYFGSSWGLGADVSYAGMRYAHPDFMRRTTRIALGAAESEEAFELFTRQESLPDMFRLELSAWKRFRLGSESSLTLSLRLENLLGDESTPYSAYESSRLRSIRTADAYIYRPLDNSLRYASPRSFYLSASIRF